jgi:hypothetical protein
MDARALHAATTPPTANPTPLPYDESATSQIALRPYLFDDKYLFHILPNQQHARSDFCLIS